MGGKRAAKKSKKAEFSKIACCFAFVVFLVLGIWMVLKYYSLVQMAIETGATVMPDATLPIAGISFILAPLVSYLLYQGGLKNSRNKYGIDCEGEPFKREIEQ